jgi:hypothetical protein
VTAIAEAVARTGTDPSLAHLLGRLDVVVSRARHTVAVHRVPDPGGDERFRGLYISDAEVDAHLSAESGAVLEAADPDSAALTRRVENEADGAEAEGADLRLRRLAEAFGLNELDIDLLLVALAPDIDPRLERVYAYLHDDVSRRRASTGLALQLCGAERTSAARFAFAAGAPLVSGGLLVIDDADRPFLTRSLRVPDRVTAHLLGDDRAEPSVAELVTPCAAGSVGDVGELVAALAGGCRLAYVHERPGGAGLSMAGRAFTELGVGVLSIDLARVGRDDDVRGVVQRLAREALLSGRSLLAGPVEALADRGPEAVRPLAETRARVVLVGSRAWDPQWSREVPFSVEAEALDHAGRCRIWSSVLDGTVLDGASVDLGNQFRLTPEQIGRASAVAQAKATAAGRALRVDDLRAGSRAQNAAGLERLARRVAPRVGWEDLVLAGPVVTQLRDLASRVRQRERVLDEWGMGRRSSKGRGVKALFAGESGTGKTLAAEAIAGDLGLDMYVVDLSTVVDKYVGETEKNLDRIFAEADRVNGVLLFDEADALFGRRSEVKDAQDRYANVEVAYLLQRMESFDGLAILTTNLRANLDEAFARRLDAIADFPMPEEEDRQRLWELNLALGAPLADDIDLGFLAAQFKLSGGSIRNIVLSAAFEAAESRGAVGMGELVRGTIGEYRKLGRLVVEAEFGPFLAHAG